MSERTGAEGANTDQARAFGQPVRLWTYVALILGGGLGFVFGPLHHAPAVAASHVGSIPWWGIFLLATAAVTLRELVASLGLLGIESPEAM